MNLSRRVAVPIAVAVVAIQAFSFSPDVTAQAGAAPTTFNWTTHNYDLSGTRFVPLTQITRDNVKSLAPRWIFQHGVIDESATRRRPSSSTGRCM